MVRGRYGHYSCRPAGESSAIAFPFRENSVPAQLSGIYGNKRCPLYLQLRTRTRLIDLYPYFNTHFTCIFSYLEFDNCSILQFFFHFVLVIFSTNNFCKPQQR